MFPFAPPCLTPAHLADIAEHPLPMAEVRHASLGPETCIGPVALAKQEGVAGDYDQTQVTTHFLLAWDSTNSMLDQATLDVVEAALERSWTVLIDENGWLAPDETASCLITVVLADLDETWEGTGGWTNVNATHGVPYMVLNTDWATDTDWTETLIAHEFNHASQFAYDVFWREADWWYWESTAEWSIELPYPDANTWGSSLSAYLAYPWLALDSQRSFINYGHFVFNVYLDEQVGRDTPRAVWASAGPEDDVESAVVTATGTDYSDLLVAYTATTAAMDVGDREAWLDTMTEFAVDPYAEHITTYPASGSQDGAGSPQARGHNLLHLAGSPGGPLTFAFTGEPDVGGVATEWAVTLSTRAADGTVVHASTYAVDGKASVVVAGLGEGVTDAYIGVIPTAAFGAGPASWSWMVGLEEESDDSGDPDDDDGGVADGGKGAETAAGCGCGGGAAPLGAAGPALAFVGLLIARISRRSR